MKTYVVGGAIRDTLLGKTAKDKDYVVVGSTPAQMQSLGYIPVGQDFPVFLHPITKEEYALARTERKSGQGYKGFTFYTSPDVSLEDDLVRRDFTINAMAQEIDSNGHLIGPIIDPCHGQIDLKNKCFRHVSAAFTEDPLRILRLARFLARFTDFWVAQETMDLVKGMVAQEELKYLVPNRVWQELCRGLMESSPSKMLQFLAQFDENSQILPSHLKSPTELIQIGHYLDQLPSSAGLEWRFAILLFTAPEETINLWLDSYPVPTDIRNFVKGFYRIHTFLHSSEHNARGFMNVFDQTDLWRKPERFYQMVELAKQLGFSTDLIHRTSEQALLVNAGEIAKNSPDKNGQSIANAVDIARLKAIASCL